MAYQAIIGAGAYLGDSLKYILDSASSYLPERKSDPFTIVDSESVQCVEEFNDIMAGHTIVRLAGLCGGSAVILGAYGSHALRNDESIDQKRKYSFETANRYHMLHSVVLLATPLCGRPKLTASLLVGGIVMFCGTLYRRALTGKDDLDRIAPIGGMTLIAAWVSMIL